MRKKVEKMFVSNAKDIFSDVLRKIIHDMKKKITTKVIKKITNEVIVAEAIDAEAIDVQKTVLNQLLEMKNTPVSYEEQKETVAELKSTPTLKKVHQYRRATEFMDSDVSDDEGALRPDSLPFAKGGFDEVRSLRPKRGRHRRSNALPEPIAKKLVFSPLGHHGGQEGGRFDSSCVKQVQKKHDFHNAMYPERAAKLYFFKGTDPNLPTTFNKISSYRYIRESFPGVRYEQLHVNNPLMAIDIMASATEAVIDAHAKGYVIVDIKPDNLFYEEEAHKKTYFSDGGLAQPLNTPLKTFNIRAEDASKLLVQFDNYAPECWTIENDPYPETKPEMDTYSLGIMFKELLASWGLVDHKALNHLATLCHEKQPAARIPLTKLLTSLEALRKEIVADENCHALSVEGMRLS